MFTGIIQDIGTLVHVDDAGEMRIRTALPHSHLSLGTSICCNGACMTVTTLKDNVFSFHVSPESRNVTTMKNWQVDTQINLEPSLRVGDELAGHYVTGHVDGVGSIKSKNQQADGNWCFEITAPPNVQKFVAAKGSITVDGVALTVNTVAGDSFAVNIIPHTFAHTTFAKLEVGQEVNLEIDTIARYVAQLMNT